MYHHARYMMPSYIRYKITESSESINPPTPFIARLIDQMVDGSRQADRTVDGQRGGRGEEEEGVGGWKASGQEQGGGAEDDSS